MEQDNTNNPENQEKQPIGKADLLMLSLDEELREKALDAISAFRETKAILAQRKNKKKKI